VHRGVNALNAVVEETGASVARVALNWRLMRRTVYNIVGGLRTEE
jgi:aryl-alcohol dehydrogenase-like predicted oxidoreductase